VEGGEDSCRLGFVRWRLWGGGCRFGWEDFGDWGDHAVGFVEDEVFDEGRWRLCRFGGGGGDGCVGTGFARQERGDDLEVVEELAGADGVEIVGGDAAEQMGGDEQGGGTVLDDGEDEGLGGVEVTEFAGGGRGSTGGVVVVAEVLVAEGG